MESEYERYERERLQQVQRAVDIASHAIMATHGRVVRAADLIRPDVPLSERITRRANDYCHRIDDRKIDCRLVSKIARAVEEKRIAEGTIESIIAACQSPNVRKRGPYFVVGVKRAFDAVHLPWFEEQWS